MREYLIYFRRPVLANGVCQQSKNGRQKWQPLMIDRNGRNDWTRASDIFEKAIHEPVR